MSRFKTISPVDDAVYVERDYASDKQIADALESAATAQLKWRQRPTGGSFV